MLQHTFVIKVGNADMYEVVKQIIPPDLSHNLLLFQVQENVKC